LQKPHYGFEKRQKEVAKQKKREAKRERKLNKGVGQPDESGEPPMDDVTPEQTPPPDEPAEK
jgi:hypothetical protein